MQGSEGGSDRCKAPPLRTRTEAQEWQGPSAPHAHAQGPEGGRDCACAGLLSARGILGPPLHSCSLRVAASPGGSGRPRFKPPTRGGAVGPSRASWGRSPASPSIWAAFSGPGRRGCRRELLGPGAWQVHGPGARARGGRGSQEHGAPSASRGLERRRLGAWSLKRSGRPWSQGREARIPPPADALRRPSGEVEEPRPGQEATPDSPGTSLGRPASGPRRGTPLLIDTRFLGGLLVLFLEPDLGRIFF